MPENKARLIIRPSEISAEGAAQSRFGSPVMSLDSLEVLAWEARHVVPCSC